MGRDRYWHSMSRATAHTVGHGPTPQTPAWGDRAFATAHGSTLGSGCDREIGRAEPLAPEDGSPRMAGHLTPPAARR
jgi:hypothetical protein